LELTLVRCFVRDWSEAASKQRPPTRYENSAPTTTQLNTIVKSSCFGLAPSYRKLLKWIVLDDGVELLGLAL
jgi:hypothetical protein